MKTRIQRKLIAFRATITAICAKQAAANRDKAANKNRDKGEGGNERQLLISGMSNHKRHQFRKATIKNEGPLSIERIREHAAA